MSSSELTIEQFIQERLLQMHLQPLVDLTTGHVAAVEALVRGPQGTKLATPDCLFAAARQAGLLAQLDAHCQELALGRWLELPEPRPRLFLNAAVSAVDDPAFDAGLLWRRMQAVGVSAHDVVLEVSEDDDMQTVDRWLSTMAPVVQAGIGVALDDWGLGPSRVPFLLRQRPEFLKVDMRLVRGIDTDTMRQALVAGMVTLAERAGIGLVAEGIETQAELETLLDLGVRLGQGYLFARPAWPPQALDGGVQAFLCREQQRRARRTRGFAPLSLGDLAQPVTVVNGGERVELVEKRFKSEGSPAVLAVADAGGLLLGFLTREYFYQRLGIRYGYELFGTRPVRELMNPVPPLMLPLQTPIDEVAQQVTADSNVPMAEYVLAIEDGRCRGIISTRRILEVLSQIRLQTARDANPLTGLPGNRWIEEEIARRTARGESFWLIYADLDKFKAFNDREGFVAGDQVIKLLGKVLFDSVDEAGDGQDFVGHVGGDDFVLMTTADPQELGACIQQRFHERTLQHTAVTVSLAALRVQPDMDLLEIGRRAARLKSVAKSCNGWALDPV